MEQSSVNHISTIRLVECPRDAMQGWKHFIPTDQKIRYINSLLKVGFDTIDFGSFVSSKAMPQMADTKEVIANLQMANTTSKLLAIVANERGAEDAVIYDQITCLGFPFSVSETFQKRNTNSTIAESLNRVEEIQNLCIKNRKQLVVYISMGFGNPYGDMYNEEIVLQWVDKMVAMDIEVISLADTVGVATPSQVNTLLKAVIPKYTNTAIGVHLHSTSVNWKAKVDAALDAGCIRFDGALKGIGGCPMANDELVGNMDTELMIPYFKELDLLRGLNIDALKESSGIANEIFI
ncbi:hydroxymethylglutaryl-CoA lyase [Ferruginibacter lapsinanis]|uniref:hydroxymethylglutaryl-CoA lyase n=1 Tax=Ferruginibacter lapsinanis TaxID=563172 RepID=UPI001E5275D0|nr:hydroxymethylglutaryl-CoA lyase [Ferruginibacter lapsinanis]UEG48908.1 hydroxymethylglutaryl-CoA lyase [Ferruginibacter lapsinanis]